MRLKKEGAELRIIVREEFPYFVDKFLNDTLPVTAYYSKSGKLAQIHCSDYFLKGDASECFIPENMPVRKYVFTFGRENMTPKICADSHSDFWSLVSEFERNEMMVVERADGGEIEYHDRYRIREDFLNEWLENGWFLDFERAIIESVYFKNKLYFYISSESYDFDTEDEFKEVISRFLEEMGYDDLEFNRKGEFTLVKARRYGKKEKFLLVMSEYDEEKDEVEVVTKEVLEDVVRRIRGSVSIIMSSENDLEEGALQWVRERKIDVKTIDEFMKEVMLERWKENDRIAEEEPEFWEDAIRDIFGS